MDITGATNVNVTYQNTSNRPKLITVSLDCRLEANNDIATCYGCWDNSDKGAVLVDWTYRLKVGVDQNFSSHSYEGSYCFEISFLVAPNQYYRLITALGGTGSVNVLRAMEIRI